MRKFKAVVALIVTLLLTVALCSLSGCNVIFGELWNDVEYDNEESYTVGGGEIEGTISDIEINWADDALTVEYYSGTVVKIEESADKEIGEELTLRYKVDGGKLTVQFATNGRHDIRGLNKKLNVFIPDGVTLNSLTLKNVSGEINAQVNAGQLNAETATGNITLGGNVPTIEVKSTSGKISVSQATVALITAKNATGDIELSFDVAAAIFVGIVSGKVNIALPDNVGFVLNLETLSGELTSELDLVQNEKTYTRLEGGSIFSVNTGTGNVNITKKV
ncbi:MAG: DUF4097 family beta strand repeat-containing protein [Candidatus Coproplasma sp.]